MAESVVLAPASGRSLATLQPLLPGLGAGLSVPVMVPPDPSGLASKAVGGRSVDTTMGFSPLEGLVMATRSGTVDPGLIVWLLHHGRLGLDEVAAGLEQSAGLAGLSGVPGATCAMSSVLLPTAIRPPGWPLTPTPAPPEA